MKAGWGFEEKGGERRREERVVRWNATQEGRLNQNKLKVRFLFVFAFSQFRRGQQDGLGWLLLTAVCCIAEGCCVESVPKGIAVATLGMVKMLSGFGRFDSYIHDKQLGWVWIPHGMFVTIPELILRYHGNHLQMEINHGADDLQNRFTFPQAFFARQNGMSRAVFVCLPPRCEDSDQVIDLCWNVGFYLHAEAIQRKYGGRK